jgi:hypothetical protein
MANFIGTAGDFQKEKAIGTNNRLTDLPANAYSNLRNNPGSFGEGARSRSERIGSCFLWGAFR